MDDATARQIAADLFAAHQTKARYEPSSDAVTALPLAFAYRVQDEFNRLQRDAGAGEPVGYKIALTSTAMQEFVGVGHPLAGVIFSSRVHRSPSRQSLADYQHVGVEFEVTVRLGEALPAAAGPHTRDSLARAVATCAASYELVEDRDADFAQVNPFNLVAENAWNAGLILGEEIGDWQHVDLEHGATRLWVNGEPAGEGRTGDALGHPFDAVAWLANLLNERDRQLEAGMLVMTGSSITTRFPTAGEHYRFAVDGLGEVTLQWEGDDEA